MATTWSVTNKNANVILSNGNLTAASGTSLGGDVVGLATSSITSGQKIYFEVAITAANGDSQGAGVGNISTNLTTGDYLGVDTNSIGLFQNGGVIYNNAFVATFDTFVQGDVVCVAVDFSNGNIWWRVNAGNWNASGTANPATNTGGYAIGVTGSLFPAYDLKYNGTTQNQSTANFGATAFAHSPPAGFTGLDTPGGGTVTMPPVALSAASSSSALGHAIKIAGAVSILAQSSSSASGHAIKRGAARIVAQSFVAAAGRLFWELEGSQPNPGWATVSALVLDDLLVSTAPGDNLVTETGEDILVSISWQSVWQPYATTPATWTPGR